MGKRLIKVLIVDDSGFMKLLIRSILRNDDTIEVVGEASNGKEAYELTKKYQPDVVVMDMQMPDYDGLYGVRMIMADCPTSILILSALGYSEFDPIMQSLELGAFDYVNKPQGNLKLKVIDTEILRKIKLAAKAGKHKPVPVSLTLPSLCVPKVAKSDSTYEIVAIGSSTGGPTALETLVKALPADLSVPTFIVQHMPAAFIHPFAKRLDSLVAQQVCVARVGMRIKPGVIYVAPGDMNVRLVRKKGGAVEVEENPENFPEYNKPSINSMMLSVAEVYGGRAIGVILTGMGRDGARGLSAISACGGYTIVQDEASSVVFGMPKEALSSCPVRSILPIADMGRFIGTRLTQSA